MFANYTELKSAIADYLHRSNLSDSVLSTFVQLGEARLNRKLRLSQQERTDELIILQGTNLLDMPSGCVEIIDLIHADDKQQIAQQSVRSLNSQTTYDETQREPLLFAVTDDFSMKFDAYADRDYPILLTYFKGWDIAGDTTNWLLSNAPDAYLYASLLEAKAYVRNQTDIGVWSSALQTAIDDLNVVANRNRRNATTRCDSSLVRSGTSYDIRRGY